MLLDSGLYLSGDSVFHPWSPEKDGPLRLA